MALPGDLEAEAHSLGFLLIGITTPEPPAHLPVYDTWLAQGRHGGMAYLAASRARQRRADPGLILPGAASLISLAFPYPSPPHFPPANSSSPTGRVAAYAWGEDYHAIIPPRLDRLAQRLGALLGRPVAQRRYTDTGPILEREMAQRAGLGWIGKNTCLISPRHGSFFFLAELFSDAPLEPDPPFTADRCGSCRRCIEACPTGCIREDRTLDATHCISYLTIENKGSIPPALRPQVGNWVFGCDVCQEVCPWNLRFAGAPADASLVPRPGLPHPDLLSELSLSAPEFNRKFKGSPLLRARRRGYLRNVCVALGNQPVPEAAAPLARILLEEPEPLLRAHAAWALGRLSTAPARAALQRALSTETDLLVISEILTALGN